MKLHRGDNIVVLAGRDKGKSGTVARVLPSSASVIVEGVNISKRHTKPSAKRPRGGILDLVKPLSSAKVALVCPHCHKPTRIGYQIKGDHKDRICRKCQEVIK